MYENRGDGKEFYYSYYDALGNIACIRHFDNENFYIYYTVCNGWEHVTALYDQDGWLYGKYTYDSWGKLISITDMHGDDISAIDDVPTRNSIRYRGYVYDSETGFYYLNTRYYDPEVCRFISADAPETLTATPMGLTDKNLYAYCDNNPIVRVDCGGQYWETAFDAISFSASVVEVSVNPEDPWAWAALVGDAIDLALPFVGGVGEMTRAVKTTVRAVDKADDVIDVAKKIYKTDGKALDLMKSTGSYEIIFKNKKRYVGKGSFQRAIASAKRYEKPVKTILWKSAPTVRDAFIDEYFMQARNKKGKEDTYNKIWSPGRRYFLNGK